MTARLLIVTGTGTGIGKTVVSAGLVAAWGRRGLAVAGIKPIESGQPDGGGDVAELERASTFRGPRSTPPYLLREPLSPHLAARREGRAIDLPVVTDWVEKICAVADAVVLELPGGLFTPLADDLTNADLVRALKPDKVLLVAPDRLGVLHDVIATSSAARSLGVRLDGLVLSTPAEPDDATGTNEAELARVLSNLPVLAVLHRGTASSFAPALDRSLERLGL